MEVDLESDKLNRWLTLGANIGVIAGLIFLALEIRHAQMAMQSQAFQTRALDAIAWDLEMAKDEDLGRMLILIESGNLDPDSLSESDWQIAYFLLDGARIDTDNEHYQYQNGFLDSGFYNGVTVPMIRFYAPIWRRFGVREGRPEFRREVDRILTETTSSLDETDSFIE